MTSHPLIELLGLSLEAADRNSANGRKSAVIAGIGMIGQIWINCIAHATKNFCAQVSFAPM
jgi:hypothetical protein